MAPPPPRDFRPRALVPADLLAKGMPASGGALMRPSYTVADLAADYNWTEVWRVGSKFSSA
eukprot:1463279-Prymnesium_polylepis.1